MSYKTHLSIGASSNNHFDEEKHEWTTNRALRNSTVSFLLLLLRNMDVNSEKLFYLANQRGFFLSQKSQMLFCVSQNQEQSVYFHCLFISFPTPPTYFFNQFGNRALFGPNNVSKLSVVAEVVALLKSSYLFENHTFNKFYECMNKTASCL